MKGLMRFPLIFLVLTLGFSLSAEAKKKEDKNPFAMKEGWEDEYTGKESGIRCIREGSHAWMGEDRRTHCAVFGIMDNPMANPITMFKNGQAIEFQTQNPRACRDECLRHFDCKAFSWRRWKLEYKHRQPTCRVFTKDLKGMGLEVDLEEKDTEDEWVYWDRNCGRCRADDSIPR